MADSFGFDPFALGDPSGGGDLFQPITEQNIGQFDPAVGAPSGSAISLSLPASGSSSSLLNAVGTFANFGRTLTNDVFSYELQSQQIAKGQLPSIATDGTGRPSGQLQQLSSALKAGSTGTFLLFGGVALLLVILMTAGKR
jgi:hypothetical protein